MGNKQNESNKMWGGVFDAPLSEVMVRLNSSIDIDKQLYRQDIKCSLAHSRMLCNQGVLTAGERGQIEDGLERILREIEVGEFEFKQEMEDIHMNIESRLTELIGDAGKKLHTARSRNDQVATDFKLYVKDACRNIKDLLVELMRVLTAKAKEHLDDVMPSFTHLQIAQPISVGHYFLAYVEMFWRDLLRTLNTVDNLDSCPLGSAAVAGTTYDIDRNFTAAELGFQEPTRNSIDSVSDRDFALEFLASCSIMSVHLSRLAEEMVIFCTSEFSYIKMSDQFSTGSSIMPQKRNPDAAELIRAKTGVIFGNLMALLTAMKGLPLSYSKDMQEDKLPVFSTNANITLSLMVMTQMLDTLTLDTEKLSEAAHGGYSTATDLADYLVQKLGVPFRESHHITGNIVKNAIKNNQTLEQVPLKNMQEECPRITSEVFDFITVRTSVQRRKSFGGTSFQNVKQQVDFWESRLQSESPA